MTGHHIVHRTGSGHGVRRNVDTGRMTFLYKTVEEVTVLRPYQEEESNYNALEGFFVDASNAERKMNAVLPDRYLRQSDNLYGA
ncbi:hypothetical protein BGX23_001925, partial [Mortierella sp. AD031]